MTSPSFRIFLMPSCNDGFCHTHDPVGVSGSTEKYENMTPQKSSQS